MFLMYLTFLKNPRYLKLQQPELML
jgi:hypothetical protein